MQKKKNSKKMLYRRAFIDYYRHNICIHIMSGLPSFCIHNLRQHHCINQLNHVVWSSNIITQEKEWTHSTFVDHQNLPKRSTRIILWRD